MLLGYPLSSTLPSIINQISYSSYFGKNMWIPKEKLRDFLFH